MEERTAKNELGKYLFFTKEKKMILIFSKVLNLRSFSTNLHLLHK